MAKDYKSYTTKNGEKRYLFDVNLGYRADGSRIRTTVRAKSIKEGRKKVSELRLGQKYVIENDSMLFSEAYDLFVLDRKNRHYSRTSLDNIEFIYRKEYTRFENVKLNKIKDVDLLEWRNYLNKKLAIDTVRTRESALNAFFNWCIKKKLLNDNQYTYIDRIKKQKTKIDFYTEEEFEQLLEVINNDVDKVKIETLFYTGLRKGEFCGLSIYDLDERNNCLNLSHTVKSTRENGVHITDRFKNENSKRIVPLPRWLTPRLKTVLESSKYPFLHDYTTLGRTIQKYMKKANLHEIRVHDFRHSYASMLIAKGVDIYTISQMLGHADIKTTINTYGHLYPDKRKQITDLFDK